MKPKKKTKNTFDLKEEMAKSQTYNYYSVFDDNDNREMPSFCYEDE